MSNRTQEQLIAAMRNICDALSDMISEKPDFTEKDKSFYEYVCLSDKGEHQPIEYRDDDLSQWVPKIYWGWGTFGGDGKQPLKWVRLIDCSTEHLLNILRTQFYISTLYVKVINLILEGRS